MLEHLQAGAEDAEELRDLLVTVHAPILGSGRAVRTYGIARAIASRRGLDLLYVPFGGERPDSHFESIPGVGLRPVAPSRGLRRAGSYVTARLRRVPDAFARGVSPELVHAARRLSQEPHRGRVIADGPTAAAALLGLAGRRPVIYNAHNLESAFRHELEGGRHSQRALRSFEARVLCAFQECWMVSEADVAGAAELCGSATLRLVPNAVDTAAIAPVARAVTERRAIFVANFRYEPNRNALRFLLEEVMPRVWPQLPSARLAVVGAGLEERPSADERVETCGFVEDLGAVYARSSCAVAPLLQGGGTPLKLIEALAYGLPVVATPRAAAGLQLCDGEHCLLAADGPAFARALIALLRGDGTELGRHGRELVEQRYSITAIAELLAPARGRR